MKALVTGVRGQLGYDVCRELVKLGIEFRGTGSNDMDITDREIVRETVRTYRPDVVLHCAAYTAVDRAEDEPERAFAVNEAGTRNMAEACAEAGAKMVYISTDYVFPGTGERPYEADDGPGPLNVYGESKLAGELAVKSMLEKYFIVRTSWVFGSNGTNFVKTMLKLAETRAEINVVCDQVGSPTYTADLAKLLCGMIVTEKYGVYHATNEGVCSWADFAEEIFRCAGRNTAVRRVTSEQYSARAARPRNSRMSKQCLSEAGFSRLPVWQDALHRYLRELQ